MLTFIPIFAAVTYCLNIAAINPDDESYKDEVRDFFADYECNYQGSEEDQSEGLSKSNLYIFRS
jgi:hypothetical protein